MPDTVHAGQLYNNLPRFENSVFKPDKRSPDALTEVKKTSENESAARTVLNYATAGTRIPCGNDGLMENMRKKCFPQSLENPSRGIGVYHITTRLLLLLIKTIFLSG